MATCKYCGQWVAGIAEECSRCKRKAERDSKFRNRYMYNLVRRQRIKLS